MGKIVGLRNTLL